MRKLKTTQKIEYYNNKTKAIKMNNVDRFSRYNIKQGFLLQCDFLSPNLISPLERQNLQQSVL